MMRSHQVVPGCFVSKRGLINLSSITDSVFRRQFRFAKDDFATLCQALRIPKMVSSAQGVNIPGWEALCLYLTQGLNFVPGILFESDLYSKLERLVGEHHYAIYGDPAYPLRHLIIKPYGGSHLTREQQNFNSAMTTVRQAVEWVFEKAVSEFAFLDSKMDQKLLLQAVPKMYPSGSHFN
ncbi:hypothetical protein HPB48_000877 [Haemaphysalis longicornis]|uniref:DDE Tnp4 domain-containing protein n=1 Tax=Haemaphysalis longicornis TaxID=44386 RepID=A0A9J6GU92_HAELO|nr:hypothetical protein HPB48_000877 [Haemaphysalis longicornis]